MELSELVEEGGDPYGAIDHVLDTQPQSLYRHYWAIRIVFTHFAVGLGRLTEPAAMSQSYGRFLRDADPIYSTLLAGLDDDALAFTWISYWKTAHTLATQSRFWLEDAIAEIVERDPRWEGKKRRVYTARTLGAGLYERGLTLSDLGEVQREEVLGRRSPWEALVQKTALEAVDRIVGTHERSGGNGKSENWRSSEAIARDAAELDQVEKALVGPPPETVTLQCSLLIVEPDRLDGGPHTWAFRFVNPRTFSPHSARKQERVNLLRLFAYLAQEKPLRDPKKVQVAVVEIVPRAQQVSGARYFSSRTYWDATTLWDFLGVPFAAVQVGITAAGRLLSNRLREGLIDLLPSEPEPPNPAGN